MGQAGPVIDMDAAMIRTAVRKASGLRTQQGRVRHSGSVNSGDSTHG
jgi:hypothetical protein